MQRENFFWTVFKAAGARDCLNSFVTLDLDFTVLLPASDVWRHIVELYLFLQKFVHLSFDWVLLARFDKGSAEVKSAHWIEIFMRTTEYSYYSEIRVEKVFPVASIGNTIVNYLLQNYLHCGLAVETQIFTVASHNFSVFFQTFFHAGAVWAFMLN